VRDLTPEMDDGLRRRVVRPHILMRMDHPAGTLRLWTGLGTLDYDGFSWTGAGSLIAITPLEDSTEIRVAQGQITLPGIDFSDEAMEMILTPVARVPVHRWLAFLDDRGNVIPDPIYRAKMYADPPVVSYDGQGKSFVTVPLTGAVFNLTLAPNTLLSNEEQLALYPDDSGLSQMEDAANQQLTWTAGAYNNFTPPP